MTVCLGAEMTIKDKVSTWFPTSMVSGKVSCITNPEEILLPSTTSTEIGLGICRRGMEWQLANSESMKLPEAPESNKAWVVRERECNLNVMHT